MRPAVDGNTRVRSPTDRKSTRLNSSHSQISYAVFCLKKKKQDTRPHRAEQSPGAAPQAAPHPPGQQARCGDFRSVGPRDTSALQHATVTAAVLATAVE